MKTAYRTRCWADLTARRPDRSPVEGSFGRRYLAALLGTPTLAPPVEQTRTAKQRSFFGPLLAAASIVVVVTSSSWVLNSDRSALSTVAVEPVEVRSAQIVIALDESASLTTEDIALERVAANFVARTQLSSRSSVAVLGFSDDVQVLCPMTRLASKQERDSMSTCISKTTPRNPKGGTNHVAVLREAINQFAGTEPGDQRMIFLLTDGKLDVSGDPAWGLDPSQRNVVAQEALDTEVAKARDQGVQIWPIGFGPLADGPALTRLANDGYRGSCLGQPRPFVMGRSTELVTGVVRATADAQCAEITPGLNAGGAGVEFSVDVPEVAEAAVINVVKVDAATTVRLFDPSGRPVPKSGQIGETTLETDGEQDMVEVIRMTRPQPGRWRISVNSPGRAATVFATWTS